MYVKTYKVVLYSHKCGTCNRNDFTGLLLLWDCVRMYNAVCLLRKGVASYVTTVYIYIYIYTFYTSHLSWECHVTTL